MAEKLRSLGNSEEIDSGLLGSLFGSLTSLALRREFYPNRLQGMSNTMCTDALSHVCAASSEIHFTFLDHLATTLLGVEEAMVHSLPGAESFAVQILGAYRKPMIHFTDILCWFSSSMSHDANFFVSVPLVVSAWLRAL